MSREPTYPGESDAHKHARELGEQRDREREAEEDRARVQALAEARQKSRAEDAAPEPSEFTHRLDAASQAEVVRAVTKMGQRTSAVKRTTGTTARF